MRKYFILTFCIILFAVGCKEPEQPNLFDTVDKRPVKKTKVIKIGSGSYYVLRGSDSCQYLSKTETAESFNWQTLCHYPLCDNPAHKNK